MTKLLATVVALKGILIAASVALARGDALPIVLISAMLSLIQVGKPVSQVVPRETTVVSPSHDPDGRSQSRAGRL